MFFSEYTLRVVDTAEPNKTGIVRKRDLFHFPHLQPNEHRVRLRLCLRLRRKHAQQLHPARKFQRKNFAAKTDRKIGRDDPRSLFRHQLCSRRIQSRIFRHVVPS